MAPAGDRRVPPGIEGSRTRQDPQDLRGQRLRTAQESGPVGSPAHAQRLRPTRIVVDDADDRDGERLGDIRGRIRMTTDHHDPACGGLQVEGLEAVLKSDDVLDAGSHDKDRGVGLLQAAQGG